MSFNVFLLLEMTGCGSRECVWVKVVPVMCGLGCLKMVESFLEVQQTGNYFRFESPFQLPEQGGHSSGKRKTSCTCSEMDFTQRPTQ